MSPTYHGNPDENSHTDNGSDQCCRLHMESHTEQVQTGIHYCSTPSNDIRSPCMAFTSKQDQGLADHQAAAVEAQYDKSAVPSANPTASSRLWNITLPFFPPSSASQERNQRAKSASRPWFLAATDDRILVPVCEVISMRTRSNIIWTLLIWLALSCLYVAFFLISKVRWKLWCVCIVDWSDISCVLSERVLRVHFDSRGTMQLQGSFHGFKVCFKKT